MYQDLAIQPFSIAAAQSLLAAKVRDNSQYHRFPRLKDHDRGAGAAGNRYWFAFPHYRCSRPSRVPANNPDWA